MGKFRLACLFCDRNEYDAVDQIPATWFAVDEVQSYEDSIKEIVPPGDEALAWWTHLGVCPDCQEAELWPAGEVADLRAERL